MSKILKIIFTYIHPFYLWNMIEADKYDINSVTKYYICFSYEKMQAHI